MLALAYRKTGCFLVVLLALTPSRADAGEDQKSLLAKKCGNELAWAKDWKSAAERARAERRVVLVFVQLHADFRAIAEGPLMDRDIVSLINEHCVPVRYRPGSGSPIDSYERYGIGPYSFGSTVLITKPDGTVLGDLLASRTIPFRDFLLQKLPPLTSKNDLAEFAKLKRFSRVSRLMARGHVNEALKLLKKPRDAAEFLLKADALRLLRRGDQALEALEKARVSDAANAEPHASISEAVIRLRMGQADRGLQAIELAMRSAEGHKRYPELLFWRGASLVTTEGTKSAAQVWNTLLDRFPDSRWSWQAAGLMNRKSFAQGVAPSFAWPTEGTIEFLRTPIPGEFPVGKLAKAKRDAIHYLLTRQRKDGSWRSTPAELQASLYRTDSLTVAVTAISARALLGHRDEERVQPAISSALMFTKDWAEREATRKRQPYLYDYSAWGYAYALRLFASCVTVDLARRDDLKPAVRAMLSALKRMQMRGGGWNYRIATIRDGKAVSTNQSASFMTATAVLAMLEAREAGFEISDDVLKAGVDCVARSRRSNGIYEYFLTHSDEARRGAREQGSAGRGPVCTLALLRSGKVEPPTLRASLDVFMKHGPSYARETGKSLMHAGPDSQGSHYLLFDYAWAAEAVRELPARDQALYRTRLREFVLKTRLSDGSFLDNPINGSHFGAGMALETMNALQ